MQELVYGKGTTSALILSAATCAELTGAVIVNRSLYWT